MATFNERIQVVIDVVSSKATAGLKDFRSAVSEAQGFTGKLKAGVSSLGETFGAAIKSPAAMATAVTAVGAAALKTAESAMNLGLAVGDLADRSGLSAEQASRMLEVTSDLGISSDSLTSVLNKLNRSIDPAKFDQLGIAIARTSSGTVDINDTFLNVIDRLNSITDPTQKATVATQLLGKNWQSVSELISKGADGVAKSLAAVGDEKVFDERDIKQSREMRDSFEDLSDAVGLMAAELGKNLIPVMTTAAKGLTWLAKQANDAYEAITPANESDAFGFQAMSDAVQAAKDLGDSFFYTSQAKEQDIKTWDDLENALYDNKITTDQVAEAIRTVDQQMRNALDATSQYGDAAAQGARYSGLLAAEQKHLADNSNLVEDSLKRAKGALKDLQDQIKGRNDLVDLVVDLDDIKTKLDEITQAHEEDLISDREYWLQAAQLTGDAQQAVADYVSELDSIPDPIKTDLILNFDPNAPEKFLEKLQAELSTHNVTIGVVPGRIQPGPQDGPDTSPRSRTNSSTPPTTPNVTINVTAPVGASQVEIGRGVHDALQSYYRNGGEP
jgi:hypothetical protein